MLAQKPQPAFRLSSATVTKRVRVAKQVFRCAARWSDINWEKRRLTVLVCETEHHGGDHAMRVVPICPELRLILADAFEQAGQRAKQALPLASRKGVNLRTHLERIIAKAGHEA